MPTQDRKALKQYFRNIMMLAGILVLCLGFFYSALAWTEPTQAPPNSNTPTPLNVGPNYQTKVGVLQIKNSDANSADNADGNWFHIGGYTKTFDQAKAACVAASARLAYYSEIVDAFKNGANTCSWGWISEGFIVYPMQNGAGAGCGGAVGGVRVSYPAQTGTYGAYCARDSFVVNGSSINGGNLYAKGIYLNSGQSGGQIYLGLLANGSNADKLGICIEGTCKTTWDQIAGTSYWTASGNNIYNSNTGNVGIGTASPSTLLSLGGSLGMKLAVYDGGTPATSYGFGIQSGRMFAQTSSGIEAMAWTSAGNIGIGTTNPSTAKLVINPGGQPAIDAGAQSIVNLNIGSGVDTNAATIGYVKSAVGGGPGGFVNANQCTADGTCETNNISAVGSITASGNLIVGGSAQAAKFDGAYIPRYQTWNSQGTGAGGAAIYNDNTGYNALMIVGNNQGLGYGRWVRIWDSLWVNTRIDAPIYYDSSNTGYYVDPAGTSVVSGLTVTGSGSFGGVAISAAAINGWNTASTRVTNSGGNWDSAFSSWGTHTVTCSSGQAVTQINGAGGTSVCGAAGLSQNDIETRTFNNFHVNKLYVTTIDPVYEIDGEKYATYVSDFAGGVRIETSGILRLLAQNDGFGAVVDFNNLAKGSDLWLFWQTSNKNIKDLVVILTPGFDGKTWYEKQDNKIVIHGDKNGEVSYRLSLPRKDASEWPNKISK